MVSHKITTEQLLSDLAEVYASRELQDGEITVSMFCKQTGLSKEGARKALEREVVEGNLVVENITLKGQRTNIYRRPDNWVHPPLLP